MFARRIAAAVVASLLVALVGPSALPAHAEDGDVVVTHDVAYGAAPDENGATETLLLDLYQPADVGTVRRPAVVWAHGGGFSSGDKAEAIDVAAMTEFARRGYVAASINYRMRDDVFPEFPVAAVDAQHDMQAAVRYVRAHADELGVDPARISVAGFSAGAITALRVGAYPNDPGTSGTPGVSSAVTSVVSVSGYLRADIPAGAPPLLMLHGADDALVLPSWAEDTCDRWTAAGSVCNLQLFEGAGHDVSTEFAEAVGLIERFFACRVGSPIDFRDVRLGGRAASTVSWVMALGIADGYPDGTFRPHASLTRNQLSHWLWEYLGQFSGGNARSRSSITRGQAAMYLWVASGSRPGAPAAPFTDVDPSTWYAPGVDWVAAHHLASGFAGGTFRPNEPITRAQFAGFLRTLAGTPDAWGSPPERPLCFSV